MRNRFRLVRSNCFLCASRPGYLYWLAAGAVQAGTFAWECCGSGGAERGLWRSVSGTWRGAAACRSSTASRALRGSGRVSAATEARVRAAAAALGYRPNASARALRTARSGFVGLVITNLANTSFHTVAEVDPAGGRPARLPAHADGDGGRPGGRAGGAAHPGRAQRGRRHRGGRGRRGERGTAGARHPDRSPGPPPAPAGGRLRARRRHHRGAAGGRAPARPGAPADRGHRRPGQRAVGAGADGRATGWPCGGRASTRTSG